MAQTLTDALNRAPAAGTSSPLDKNQVYLNGQLVSTNTPGVQQLSQQAGLAAPSTLPETTQALGGTQKQIDMTGSPAQQNKAIQISSQPSTQLANRPTNPQYTPTTQQQGQIQSAQVQPKLNGLQDRVNQLINSKIQALPTSTPALPTSTSVPGLTDALNALAKNPSDQNALAQVNQLVGSTTQAPLTSQQLLNYYQTPDQSISATATAQLPTNLTVSNLVGPQLGYSLSDLSNLLGIDQATLGGMTLPQLQAEIQTQSTNLNQAAQAQATSGEIGGAERAGYTELSRGLETSGVAAAESSTNQLVDQIQKGNTVNFNGQTYDLQTLLGSQGITQLVRDYITAAPGSSTRTELDQTEPDLSKFINSNLDALTQFSNQLGASTQQFAITQSTEAQLNQAGNTTLSDSVMKLLIPTWGQFQGKVTDTSTIPVLANLKGLSTDQQTQVATALNEIASSHPELASQIPNLTAAELTQIANPTNFNQLSANTAQLGQIQSVIANNNINGALQLVFGAPTTVAQVQQLITEDQQRQAMGLPGTGISQILSPDVLNSGSAQKILDATGVTSGTSAPTNLETVASGTEKTYQAQALPTVNQGLSSKQASLLNDFSPYMNSSGQVGAVSTAELEQMGITPADLAQLPPSFLQALNQSSGTNVSTSLSGDIQSRNTAPLLSSLGLSASQINAGNTQQLMNTLYPDQASAPTQANVQTALADAQGKLQATNTMLAQANSNPSQYDVSTIQNLQNQLQAIISGLQIRLNQVTPPTPSILPNLSTGKNKGITGNLADSISKLGNANLPVGGAVGRTLSNVLGGISKL